jgi:hypothetical protein
MSSVLSAHIALKSRTFWMQDLATGWPMIRANLPAFFVILVLMIGVVWVVVNWSYTDVLVASVARPLRSLGPWGTNHFPDGVSRVH